MKSILLCNCGIWALTPKEDERLNSYHRKQQERSSTLDTPVALQNLSIQILLARWSLFGHILRRDKDIHANKVARVYFISNGNKLRGRSKTTVPIVLNRNLALIQQPKQRPGRDHRPSTGQETLEGIYITDRQSCRRVTDEELGRDTTISEVSPIYYIIMHI